MSAPMHSARSFLARVHSDLGRMIAVALCAVLLLAPLHAAFAGTGSSSSPVVTAPPSDSSGLPSDPDGLAGQHGVHCGCGVIASEFSASPTLPSTRTDLRFTAGPSGLRDASSPPTAPPPRS